MFHRCHHKHHDKTYIELMILPLVEASWICQLSTFNDNFVLFLFKLTVEIWILINYFIADIHKINHDHKNEHISDSWLSPASHLSFQLRRLAQPLPDHRHKLHQSGQSPIRIKIRLPFNGPTAIFFIASLMGEFIPSGFRLRLLDAIVIEGKLR